MLAVIQTASVGTRAHAVEDLHHLGFKEQLIRNSSPERSSLLLTSSGEKP